MNKLGRNRTLWISLRAALATTAVAYAQSDPASFPPRHATLEDAKLLAGSYAGLKRELDRLGLHQRTGETCTTFVTADSIRPIETPLPLDSTTVTLPYASFLMWSSDRPYASAVLYHVFTAIESFYKQPQKIPAGTTNNGKTYEIVLAARQSYPTASVAAQQQGALASGPFLTLGSQTGTERLAVKPFFFPTQSDDPASVLPHKPEHSLQVTCLSDPDRVKNCICAGTQ